MKTKILCLAIVSLLLPLSACDQEATVQGPANSAVTLKKPSAVTLKRGDAAEVKVQIERQNVTEPVAITFSNLPEGVTVVDSGKNISGDEGTFVIKADETGALVHDHHADVTATGPDGAAVKQVLVITVEEKAS